MFLVAFGHDMGSEVVTYSSPKQCNTLEEARSLRDVSGDLVFFEETKRIVPSEAWLFDWEKKEQDCYAKRKIKNDVSLRVWRVRGS